MHWVRVFAAVLGLVVLASGTGCDASDDPDPVGTHSGDGSTGSSEATDTDGAIGEGPAGKGILVGDVTHSYSCIDGCEGFYEVESFGVEITFDDNASTEVTVEVHDWTQSERELQFVDVPLSETVTLPSRMPVTVNLWRDRDGFCSMGDSWDNEPMRVLLTIDGARWETQATSSGASGFDC